MLGGGDGSLWEIRGREMKGITGGCCKLHLYVIATCPVLIASHCVYSTDQGRRY